MLFLLALLASAVGIAEASAQAPADTLRDEAAAWAARISAIEALALTL